MNKLQKFGGVAAIYEGVIYILGLLGFLLVLDYGNMVEPAQKAAMFVEKQAFVYILMLLVYVLFGIALVVLALALYDRLKSTSPGLMQVATVFGLIWACVVIASGMIFNVGMERVVDLYASDPGQAATVWRATEIVFEGIGGGTELLGGIWVLLVSIAALKEQSFGKALNYLGIVIGAAGILSVLPGLVFMVDIFGVLQIFWFIWLGILLLRK